MSQPVILSKLEQEYLLRIIEAAVQVRDLRQFFLWTQGQLQALLPHQLMVCLQFGPDGLLQRQEALHGSLMDEAALARLCDPEYGLAMQLARHCSATGALPCMAELGSTVGSTVGGTVGGAGGNLVLAPFQDQLAQCGFDNLLLDGTGALAGGATVFVLFGLPMRPGPRHAYFLSLLLPHLHLALVRMSPPVQDRTPAPAGKRRLTPRETEVVHWLRAGKRNDEIADILGLSALTVKNHLQRIYKALGVRNRTEAVSRCHAARMLSE